MKLRESRKWYSEARSHHSCHMATCTSQGDLLRRHPWCCSSCDVRDEKAKTNLWLDMRMPLSGLALTLSVAGPPDLPTGTPAGGCHLGGCLSWQDQPGLSQLKHHVCTSQEENGIISLVLGRMVFFKRYAVINVYIIIKILYSLFCLKTIKNNVRCRTR